MTTEKRLIDANEVWHKIHKRREAAYRELDHPRCNAYLNAEFDVMDAPTVDAVEVVHGRWTDEHQGFMYYDATCSVCGKHNDSASKFCPNCGAKMDGVFDG